MIERSTRNGLVIAAVLAAMTFWLARSNSTDNDAPTEGLDLRLEYALEDFDLRAFDETGEPTLRLWSPRLTSDAETSIGRVDTPRLEVRHEGFLWNIIADTATISSDQQDIFLGGAVRIERSGAQPSDRLDIDSRDVSLEVDRRIATSGAAVRLADVSGTLEARGFRVDMLKDEFQLHDDVQGVYEVQQ